MAFSGSGCEGEEIEEGQDIVRVGFLDRLREIE
jgi:hypothetical protein